MQRGIGAAIAERLGAEGFTVVLNFPGDPAPAEPLVQRIEAPGGGVSLGKADVSNAAAVRGLFDATIAQHGGVDMLVNNAGVESLATLADTARVR